MKIASSEMQFNASHAKAQRHEIRETLRAWIGERPDFERRQNRPAPASETVRISESGKAAQSGETQAIQDSVEAVNNDPMLRLIRSMIAILTGKEVKVFDASELQVDNSAPAVAAPEQTAPRAEAAPAQPAGYRFEYDRQESYSESEATNFAANGVVRPADGKEINFSLALSMARSYNEESSTSTRPVETRQKKDPLVINFAGNAAQLTSQRFKFDLDSDGKSEDINFVAGGSGFLALDKNGDGKINNGSELFGAQSGNGFAELAAYDTDRNGWIDENDSAYAQLRVWTKDGAGKDVLSTLKQANVGAINLASVATPFDLKDSNNALLGQVRSSSVYLTDDGNAGTVQQVDLTI